MVKVLILATAMLKAPPVPMPDEPVTGKYGCEASEIQPQPGTMPGWLLHVYAELKSGRWVRLLAARPPGERKTILRDCEKWMRLMDERVKEQAKETTHDNR